MYCERQLLRAERQHRAYSPQIHLYIYLGLTKQTNPTCFDSPCSWFAKYGPNRAGSLDKNELTIITCPTTGWTDALIHNYFLFYFILFNHVNIF